MNPNNDGILDKTLMAKNEISSKDSTNLNDLLFEKGQNSTFDGLAKVLRSKRLFLKTFWGIILLVLIGICAFILANNALNYLAYEIVTTISVRSEIPAKMPTVILCNSNGLSSNVGIFWASKVFGLYNITKSNNYIRFQVDEFPRQINNKGNILTPRTMVMTAARNPTLTDAFRKSLGLSIQDMIISCTFNSIECTSNDFSWSYDPYYGNCFNFNGTGRDQISQSGKFSGLNMELFVGLSTSVEQLTQNNGLHLFIVNETVKINTFSDGINVPTGKETNIFVDKKRIQKIQKPYGKCTPGLTNVNSYPTDYYRITFLIYDTYRQKDCFNTCFQQNSIKKLGCYCASFPYLKNTSIPACLVGLDLYYSLAYFKEFFIEDVSNKCSDCPLECDSELYSLTSSTLDYPTQIYAQMLANQSVIKKKFNNKVPTYTQLKQSIALVNINYNQLGYTQIKEIQKVNIIDLVTNFGGAIGLFLGLSFLSFFELVEILVEVIFHTIEKYILKLK